METRIIPAPTQRHCQHLCVPEHSHTVNPARSDPVEVKMDCKPPQGTKAVESNLFHKDEYVGGWLGLQSYTISSQFYLSSANSSEIVPLLKLQGETQNISRTAGTNETRDRSNNSFLQARTSETTQQVPNAVLTRTVKNLWIRHNFPVRLKKLCSIMDSLIGPRVIIMIVRQIS